MILFRKLVNEFLHRTLQSNSEMRNSDNWEFDAPPNGLAELTVNEITLFPNPSSNGVFTIQLAGSTIENITITDAQGKLVAPIIIRRETETIIDMRGYENGIYVVQVNRGRGPYAIKLVNLQ